jgi:hypothetical protein
MDRIRLMNKPPYVVTFANKWWKGLFLNTVAMSESVWEDDNQLDPFADVILNTTIENSGMPKRPVDQLVPFGRVEGRNPSALRPEMKTVDGVSDYCTLSLMLSIYSEVAQGNTKATLTEQDNYQIYDSNKQEMITKPVNFNFYRSCLRVILYGVFLGVVTEVNQGL